jgi:uncharacterized membrane protein (UPF0127 family)
MNIIEKYLFHLNKTDIDDMLSKHKVVTYISSEDIKIGLLRFNSPPEGKCFLFILPTEERISFHTMGMNFNIDIFFYDIDGTLVKSYLDVKPGVKNIDSMKRVKYVIEKPTREKLK